MAYIKGQSPYFLDICNVAHTVLLSPFELLTQHKKARLPFDNRAFDNGKTLLHLFDQKVWFK